MDSTSKTNTVEASDSGIATRTIPKGCGDAQNGVSVEYMLEQTEGYAWYVLRASYGREDRAYSLLSEQLGVKAYIPRAKTFIRTKTGVKPVIKNLIPNLVFAYIPEYEARLYVKGPAGNDESFRQSPTTKQKAVFELNGLLSFYYNHFEEVAGSQNPPLTIPFIQMKAFIIATWFQKNVIPVNPEKFEIGEEVVVVEGDFAGLRGRVIRKPDKKNRLGIQLLNNGMQPPTNLPDARRRLLLELPCLGSFGSAYIPAAYFRKAEK